MAKINTEYATIRYYRGAIREIQAQLKNALARISELEDKLRKRSRSNTSEPSNMQIFANDDINRGSSYGYSASAGPTSGGLTEATIKTLIADWIKNGELPVALHDHTSAQTGGDAYANKGAALQ